MSSGLVSDSPAKHSRLSQLEPSSSSSRCSVPTSQRIRSRPVLLVWHCTVGISIQLCQVNLSKAHAQRLFAHNDDPDESQSKTTTTTTAIATAATNTTTTNDLNVCLRTVHIEFVEAGTAPQFGLQLLRKQEQNSPALKWYKITERTLKEWS